LVFIYYYWFLIIISSRSEILEFRTIPAFSELISTSLTLTRVSVYSAVSFWVQEKISLYHFISFLFLFLSFLHKSKLFQNPNFPISHLLQFPPHFPLTFHLIPLILSLSHSRPSGQVRDTSPPPLFAKTPITSTLFHPLYKIPIIYIISLYTSLHFLPHFTKREILFTKIPPPSQDFKGFI